MSLQRHLRRAKYAIFNGKFDDPVFNCIMYKLNKIKFIQEFKDYHTHFLASSILSDFNPLYARASLDLRKDPSKIVWSDFTINLASHIETGERDGRLDRVRWSICYLIIGDWFGPILKSKNIKNWPPPLEWREPIDQLIWLSNKVWLKRNLEIKRLTGQLYNNEVLT